MTDLSQALLKRLHHPDANQRSEGVFALRQLDSSTKLPILMEMLHNETDLNVLEDIAFAIVPMGQEALPQLIALLKDKNAHIRHHAAHILGKIGHQQAQDALITTLNDADSTVVMKTIVALAQIGDAAAIPALIPHLDHENAEVRTAAVDALETFGEAGLPALLIATKHESWQICERVIYLLGSIGDEGTLPTVIEALEDKHWQVRLAAVTALHQIGGQSAQNALKMTPDDPDNRVNALLNRIKRTETG